MCKEDSGDPVAGQTGSVVDPFLEYRSIVVDYDNVASVKEERGNG
jgi:hypothetical protein